MLNSEIFVSGWYLTGGFWRLVISLLILLFGLWLANSITKTVRKSISALFSQSQLKDSPLGTVLEPAVSLRGSGILSTLVYFTIVFVFLAWSSEILGLTFLSSIVGVLLRYLPKLASALIVFVLGIILSSVVERVVKQQLRKMAPARAILMGTAASSATLILFLLISLSELGIASEFIMILFSGLVLALALAVGLAIGLGAKDLVAESLHSLVADEQQARKKQNNQKTSK
jgi:hypothetical protein